ncbi:hypothetical protein EJ02DRAFT_230560 [Clathrospora elynae]|uniref:Uncharacterized protein n=1 Tax=Clathrospora elynae TaxID=706981 RepID=A0A6A5SKK3_9PLEO|nr:hypothetical protein EJ02DRAFT_230560 [Clathrospora elynae]
MSFCEYCSKLQISLSRFMGNEPPIGNFDHRLGSLDRIDQSMDCCLFSLIRRTFEVPPLNDLGTPVLDERMKAYSRDAQVQQIEYKKPPKVLVAMTGLCIECFSIRPVTNDSLAGHPFIRLSLYKGIKKKRSWLYYMLRTMRAIYRQEVINIQLGRNIPTPDYCSYIALSYVW